MKEFNSLVLSAKAVTIFKNVINDIGVSAFIKLLEYDNSDEKIFLSLYSDFVSTLYEKTDDLPEYINKLLQDDENIYIKNARSAFKEFIKEEFKNRMLQQVDYYKISLELPSLNCNEQRERDRKN